MWMCGTTVTRAEVSVFDLGFRFSGNFSPACFHIGEIPCKALKMTGFVVRLAFCNSKYLNRKKPSPVFSLGI